MLKISIEIDEQQGTVKVSTGDKEYIERCSMDKMGQMKTELDSITVQFYKDSADEDSGEPLDSTIEDCATYKVVSLYFRWRLADPHKEPCAKCGEKHCLCDVFEELDLEKPPGKLN